MKKQIILASASPRRRELLTQVGVEFEVRVSEKEEKYESTEPEAIVNELAIMKAENVASELTPCNMVVIGADTVVVLDHKILGKPKDEEDAARMIRSLQGRAHQVFTGVAILDYDENGSKAVYVHAEETKVFVLPMEEEEIRDYISTEEPMDKAGGYGIQGRFAAYIERIEGDYYNVVGLPVSYICRQLKEL